MILNIYNNIEIFRLLKNNFEIPAITLYACCQSLCRFMLPLHASQFVADTNIDSFVASTG